jgi:hypothetical protein
LKNILRISSIAESATGIAAIIIPSIVIKLLFGIEVSGATLTISRLAGIALLSLGIACWPTQNTTQAARAMFVYNLIVAAYFSYYGVTSDLIGTILWPVAILHFVFAVLLVRGLFKGKQSY